MPGWTCFVSLLKFVAELAARRRIEGEPGRLREEEAAALKAYKEAALSDSYMFGEYNGYEAYGDIPD